MHFRILAKTEKAPPERSLNFFLKECKQGLAAGSRRQQSSVCRGVLSEQMYIADMFTGFKS